MTRTNLLRAAARTLAIGLFALFFTRAGIFATCAWAVIPLSFFEFLTQRRKPSLGLGVAAFAFACGVLAVAFFQALYLRGVLEGHSVAAGVQEIENEISNVLLPENALKAFPWAIALVYGIQCAAIAIAIVTLRRPGQGVRAVLPTWLVLVLAVPAVDWTVFWQIRPVAHESLLEPILGASAMSSIFLAIGSIFLASFLLLLYVGLDILVLEPRTLGSRFAFATWRLYRTNALARRVLDPMIKKKAEKELALHDAFVRDAKPAVGRLPGLALHWGASLDSVTKFITPEALAEGPTLEELAEKKHPIARRVYGDPPIAGVRIRLGEGRVTIDARLISPLFLASPWGCVVPDALDWAFGRSDWRTPLPPLVSARIDDVTGEKGLLWLRAFEEQGIQPSIGTLHDRWLAGPSVEALVLASKRGCSVSPHAFDMDRFIWFDARRAQAFSESRMEEHREKIKKDIEKTGLVLGKTLNAHFDVVGDTGAEAAQALGFRYVLGEHEIGQDWRASPRVRDPLGTPLYCYGAANGLFAFQAEGAIASSAAPRSRYDWLRNFLEVDRKTNLPIAASLDRKGAVKQGAVQLLSALYAGFPAYLLAHEAHLDALGPEVVGELLSDVLREVRERVPGIRLCAFDELPQACEKR